MTLNLCLYADFSPKLTLFLNNGLLILSILMWVVRVHSFSLHMNRKETKSQTCSFCMDLFKLLGFSFSWTLNFIILNSEEHFNALCNRMWTPVCVWRATHPSTTSPSLALHFILLHKGHYYYYYYFLHWKWTWSLDVDALQNLNIISMDTWLYSLYSYSFEITLKPAITDCLATWV